MTIRNWGPVRDCMRTDVTEVDGRPDVLSALKIMKKVGADGMAGHGNPLLRTAFRKLRHQSRCPS